MVLPWQLFDVRRIYLEPAAAELQRRREVLARFPDAERVEVASHWKIPTLHGNEGSAEDWLKIKREVLVLGVKKGLAMRPNGRSALGRRHGGEPVPPRSSGTKACSTT